MHQRVSTELDDHLVRRAKLESIRQGRPFDEILGEALEIYLRDRSQRNEGIVKKSWAVLPMEKETLRKILEEEDDFLDA
ncbi:MAG: hypothetical protein QOF89_3544 [Acidobacteriota bacterium]|jgi:hypothetical protein|nr:hypothetical protein [Acidobacteriota bacterium]